MASLEKKRKFSHFHVLNSTVAPPYVISIYIYTYIYITVFIVYTTKGLHGKDGFDDYLSDFIILLLSMIVTVFIWFSVKLNTKKDLMGK